MRRWELAVVVLLGLLLCVLLVTPALAFTDVSESHPYHDAIEELSGEGIIDGFGDGTFGPDEPVRRSQFAKVITLTLELPVSEDMPLGPFTDLGTDSPGSLYPHEYVACVYDHKITVGTSETTFSPWADITRAQVITMAVRAVESEFPGLLQDPSSGFSGTWGSFSPTHEAHARKAQYNDLLSGLPLSSLDPWQKMPRGEVAQVLGNLLSLLSGSGRQVPDGWTVTRLTDNTYDDRYPRIHNGQVVWQGRQPNSDGTNDWEIFLATK